MLNQRQKDDGVMNMRMIVVRLLNKEARCLYVPRQGGPSPCCGGGEFLVRLAPETLFCSRCGVVYPAGGWPT